MFFSFWLNVSFSSSHGKQGEVVLIEIRDGQKPEHHLPLQTELGLVSVPVQMSPRPYGSHLCVPPLQADGSVQWGKCKMQETTSEFFFFFPGRARAPCAMLWGSTFCGFSWLKVLEKFQR